MESKKPEIFSIFNTPITYPAKSHCKKEQLATILKTL